MTSYFDVYYPSIAEYENDDISKIHHTAERLPWDPSMEEYSEREFHMSDHQSTIHCPDNNDHNLHCCYLAHLVFSL